MTSPPSLGAYDRLHDELKTMLEVAYYPLKPQRRGELAGAICFMRLILMVSGPDVACKWAKRQIGLARNRRQRRVRWRRSSE